MSDVTSIPSLKATFRFPFQEPNWQSRFILGAGLLVAGFVIPILPGIFVYGYLLRVMRQALQGEGLSLPAWEDWWRLAVDGLRGTLVSLVFLLPGTLVFFAGMAFYFISTFSLPVLLSGAGSDADLAAPLLFLAIIAVMFLSVLVGSLLTVAGAIPLPVATAHFVARDRVGAAFHLREWWPLLRANKLGYFIAWVVVFGLMGILYFVTVMTYYTCVLCCLIPFLAAPLGFYLSLVGAALFGQTYRDSVAVLEQDSKLG